MTDLPFIVGHVQKNGREIVRATLTEFHGHKLLDLRVHAVDGDNAAPTKAGVCVRLELLPDLVALLQDAARATQSLGLIGGAE